MWPELISGFVGFGLGVMFTIGAIILLFLRESDKEDYPV